MLALIETVREMAWAHCGTAVRGDDNESGQGMVEYALILVLIAIVVIVILQIVGGQTANVFSNVSNGLGQ